MSIWRLPAEKDLDKAEERIWIILDKVFRDAGFTLWPHVHFSILRIADYSSSSGFGYANPSRGNEGVGSLRKLRQFEYTVSSFYLSNSTLV